MATIVVVVTLSACQPGVPVETDVIAEPSSSAEASSSAEPSPVVAKKLDTEAEHGERPALVLDSRAENKPCRAPLKLDISDVISVQEEGPEQINFEGEPALPDLFQEEKKGKESDIDASARLLIDEDGRDVTESVDGIEISIEKHL